MNPPALALLGFCSATSWEWAKWRPRQAKRTLQRVVTLALEGEDSVWTISKDKRALPRHGLGYLQSDLGSVEVDISAVGIVQAQDFQALLPKLALPLLATLSLVHFMCSLGI